MKKRNQAKLIMEQGNVLKKYTKIGTINKKEESLTITIFKEVQGKLQKKLCKILVFHFFNYFST